MCDFTTLDPTCVGSTPILTNWVHSRNIYTKFEADPFSSFERKS